MEPSVTLPRRHAADDGRRRAWLAFVVSVVLVVASAEPVIAHAKGSKKEKKGETKCFCNCPTTGEIQRLQAMVKELQDRLGRSPRSKR